MQISALETELDVPVSARAQYVAAVKKRLTETKSVLADIRSTIRQAGASEQTYSMERYQQAQRAVDRHLALAEKTLAQLQQSDESQWEVMKVQLESAWEDLARLIRLLICRLPD